MTRLSDLEERIKQLEGKLNVDSELPNKITDLANEYETTKNKLSEIKTNAETQNNELQQELGVVKNTKDETSSEVDETKNLLASIKSEASHILEDIKKIYDVSGETSQSMDFSRRAKDLVIPIRIWVSTFFSLLIASLILSLVYLPQWINGGLNIYQALLEKIIILAPLVTLIIFSGLQYGKNRKLYENYRAKAIFSATVRPLLAEFLPKITDEYWKKIAKKIFENIYSDVESYQPKRIKLKFGKNLLEISGEYEDLPKELLKEAIQKDGAS